MGKLKYFSQNRILQLNNKNKQIKKIKRTTKIKKYIKLERR